MISGSGLIGASIGSDGVVIDDNSRGKRLFKIVSGSNPYTAVEVVLDESDGTRGETGVYDVEADAKVLYETGGRTGVRPNTIVEATPNPSGLGFYFTAPAGTSCGSLPLTFTVAVPGFSITTTTAVVSGTTVLTGITLKQRLRDITITADGCVELGEPYCADFETSCTTGEIPDSPQWWCLDGSCIEAYDGLEPAGSTGPYATKTACVTACGDPVLISGCTHAFPSTITGTWGSNPPPVDCHTGSFALAWNGTAWVGTFSGCTGVITVTLTPGAFSGGTATWTVGMTRTGYTYTAPPATVSCGVLSTSVGSIFVSGPDSGNVTITFTE